MTDAFGHWGHATRLYSKFIGTASAIAIGVCLTHISDVARADDDQTQVIFELNGGWAFGDSQPWSIVVPFLGPTEFRSVKPNTGFGGAVGIVTPAENIAPELGSGWDVGVFARFGRTNEESAGGFNILYQNILANYYTRYPIGGVTHQETHGIVDFEARRDVGLGSEGGAKTTIKAGARFAYFGAQTDTFFDTCYCTPPLVQERRNSRFFGAGPRIGFESIFPVGTNLTFDVSGAGSLLFGVQNTSVTSQTLFLWPNTGESKSTFKVVPTFDATAALTFRPLSTGAKFSIGVRAEAWLGAFNQSTQISSRSNANRYQITPFLQMIAPIGAPASSTSAFAGGGYGGDKSAVVELQGSGGYLWRGGNELNQSGAPFTEIDDFGLLSGGALAAFSPGHDLLFQVEANGETGLGNDSISGVTANDTYAGGYTIGGQVAVTFDQLLIGGFGGAGQTFFHNNGLNDQDADHWLAGASGRFMRPASSVAVQVGYLDSTAANSETLSDAIFGRVIGQKFFNSGRTMLEGSLAFVSGTQDADDVGFVNPTDAVAWDVTLEHQLERRLGNSTLSAFLTYEGIRVREQSTSGLIDDIQDNSIMAGLKVRFGDAATLYEREMSTVPGLPNVARWLGSVPAVD